MNKKSYFLSVHYRWKIKYYDKGLMTIKENIEVTTLTIRGISKTTDAYITHEAKRLGLTKNQYYLNRLTALVHGELEQTRYPFDEALDETVELLNANSRIRGAIYPYINELQQVHTLNGGDE